MAKSQNCVLEIAKRKLEYTGGAVGGYLTPSEIHALLTEGFVPTSSCALRVPAKNEPKPRCRWFYFKVRQGTFYNEPTKSHRRTTARAHVARNLIALIEMAMDGRDGGWAIGYALGKHPDEPRLHETAGADIEDALDDVIRHLARWIP